MEREFGCVLWPRFAEFVNMRFGPPIRSNSLGELKSLNLTGYVEEYQRQFLALLCCCDNLSPRHQVDLFAARLGQPLASDVEMQRPSNLQTAMSLAWAYERRHQAADSATLAGGSPWPRNPANQAHTTRSGVLIGCSDLDSSHQGHAPTFPAAVTGRDGREAPQGECYFCSEKFSPDHKCAPKGVYLPELDDEASADEAAEELGLSLVPYMP